MFIYVVPFKSQTRSTKNEMTISCLASKPRISPMVSPHSFLAQEISGRKALLRVVQRAKMAKKKVGSKTDEGWPKNGGFSDGF